MQVSYKMLVFLEERNKEETTTKSISTERIFPKYIQISLGCQYLWGHSGSGDCLMFYWNDKYSVLFFYIKL